MRSISTLSTLENEFVFGVTGLSQGYVSEPVRSTGGMADLARDFFDGGGVRRTPPHQKIVSWISTPNRFRSVATGIVCKRGLCLCRRKAA